jgi:hypothetical protein
MTVKGKLILHAVLIPILFVGAFVGGYFSHSVDCPPATVIIKNKSNLTPTHWSQPMDTCPQCGDRIDIEGAILKDNKLGIVAKDLCKSNGRTFDLAVQSPVRHHNLIAGYVPTYDIDTRAFRHTLDAGYMYSFGHVMLGAGLAVQFDGIRVYQAGPRITAGVQW